MQRTIRDKETTSPTAPLFGHVSTQQANSPPDVEQPQAAWQQGNRSLKLVASKVQVAQQLGLSNAWRDGA